MRSKFAGVAVAILAISHLILAVMFARATPYRTPGVILSQGWAPAPDIGAPDERQHANYIRHILRTGSKPAFNPDAPDFGEEYQSHQPQMFYRLGALVARITGHTDAETQSFGRAIRTLNAFIGALGVIGTFLAGFWATGRREIGVIASAIHALLPMNIALSGAISNDVLLITSCSFSLAFILKMLAGDDPRRAQWMVATGLMVGVAAATKNHGISVLMILGGAGVWCLLTKRPEGKYLMGAACLAILVPLPHYLGNLKQFGDPFAQRAFTEAFQGSMTKPKMVEQIAMLGSPGSPEVQYWINWVGYWTLRSFIGAFGYMDIWLNESGLPVGKSPNVLYKIGIIVNGVTLLAGLSDLRGQLGRPKEERNLLPVVLVGMLVIISTFFVAFNSTFFQAQGRYLMPALAAIAGLMAIGYDKLLRGNWKLALGTVVMLFGGLAVYSYLQLGPEFAKRISG